MKFGVFYGCLLLLASQYAFAEQPYRRLVIKAGPSTAQDGDYLTAKSVKALADSFATSGDAILAVRNSHGRFFDLTSPGGRVLFCADTQDRSALLNEADAPARRDWTLKDQIVWMFRNSGLSYDLSPAERREGANWISSIVVESGSCEAYGARNPIYSSAD